MWNQRPTRSGETAGTLILIGLILQIVGVVILTLVGAFLLFLPFLGLIVLAFGIVGIVWVVLVYLYSYERTRAGDYEGARTPTLVFAILSLITFGLISGILYLVAYVKLGDAVSEAAVPPGGWSPPPIAGTRFCGRCGQPNGAPAAYCTRCGAALQ